MNIRKLPSCVLYKGRVSHTVIPRFDAESSKQLGILDSASKRGMTVCETRPSTI